MSSSGALLDRWRALPLLARDGVLALVVTAIGQAELVVGAADVEGPRALQHLAFLVMTGCLVLRRRAPVVAAGIGAAALSGQTVLGSAPIASGFIALLVVTYSVATYVDRRSRSALGLLLLVAGVLVYPFTQDVKLADEVVNTLIPVTIWVLARLARERLDRAVAVERAAQTQRLEEQVRRAVALADERRRIARELHDVVAHGVTLMLLQSEVVRGTPGLPVGTLAELDVAQDAGRRCLDDLRKLLVVLRADAAADDSAPDLAVLVEHARRAGTQVRVSTDGSPDGLPSSVLVAVHRLVQEALTNAARHAPGSAVDVRLSYGPDAVEVQVVDDGGTSGAASPGAGAGSGLGLLGVEERVGLHGGHLAAGPREDAPGWRVTARVPVPVAAL